MPRPPCSYASPRPIFQAWLPTSVDRKRAIRILNLAYTLPCSAWRPCLVNISFIRVLPAFPGHQSEILLIQWIFGEQKTKRAEIQLAATHFYINCKVLDTQTHHDEWFPFWLFNLLLVSAFLTNLRLELTNVFHYPWMKGSMLPESWGSQLLWVAYLQWVHGLRFPEKTVACQSFGPSQLQGLSWERRRWSKQTTKRTNENKSEYSVKGFRLSSSPKEVKFIDRDPHWYSRRLNPYDINRDSGMKHGCVRSDITTANRYHRPLRERFPPLIIPRIETRQPWVRFVIHQPLATTLSLIDSTLSPDQDQQYAVGTSPSIRACLHGGGGPQIGEVTCGGSSHPSCKRDQIKMRDYMDRRLPHLSGLSHLPEVPHLRVNRP